MTQCKLCMCAAAVVVAVNREVADGADVVFRDTGCPCVMLQLEASVIQDSTF